MINGMRNQRLRGHLGYLAGGWADWAVVIYWFGVHASSCVVLRTALLRTTILTYAQRRRACLDLALRRQASSWRLARGDGHCERYAG